MNKMNIVFASDPNYLVHLTVAIKSLLINNTAHNIDLHVITGNLDNSNWEILNDIVSEFKNTKLSVHKINENELSKLKINHHFKVSNYYRLFCENIIREDKVLYLDADIVVKDDISNLFNIDLNGYFLAAVENPGFDKHESLKMDQESRYFNSGVMLINLSLWREYKVFSKVLEFVSNFPEAVSFVDQCGLNAVINGKWRQLEPKYNQQSCFFENINNQLSCFSSNELSTSILNPLIIHYTGSSKPWHICNKHPYKKEYWKYRQSTAYRTFFYDDFGIKKLIKCYTPNFLKTFLKRVLNSGDVI